MDETASAGSKRPTSRRPTERHLSVLATGALAGLLLVFAPATALALDLQDPIGPLGAGATAQSSPAPSTTSDANPFEAGGPSGGTAAETPPPPPSNTTELASMRGRRSQGFITADGRQVTRMFLGSVNYRDSSGKWAPIDDTIVPSPTTGYAYRNKANRYVAEFPQQLTGPVRFDLKGDAVTMRLERAAGTAMATGSRVTFSQALPGVDVQYRAAPDALKETLLLANAGVQSAFHFRLQTTAGLTAREAPGGGIEFERAGDVVFALAAPVMQDSSRTPAGVSDKVSLSLTKDSDGYVVTLTPDQDWLSSPARVWPVALDPTVYLYETDPNRECTILSQSQSAVCRSPTNPFLTAGKNATTGERARSLLRFELGDQIPRDARISDASLKLYLSQAPPAPSTYGVYGVTRDWDSRVTWSTADGSTAWSQAGGDFEGTATASATMGTTGYQTWNIADLVQRWVNGTTVNRGVLLKGPEDGNDWAYFMSSGYFFSYYWPSLIVTWQPQGRYSSKPDKTWVVDGGTGDTPRVNAVKTLDKTLYVGGNFSSVGPRTGSFVSLRSDGTYDQTTAEVAGTAAGGSATAVPIRAIVSDGAGGWFIGGDFKYVGGQACPRLAHVRSDGTLDPQWRPLPNGKVLSLVLSGSSLYVGGSFTTIGDQPRLGIARLSASTGAVDTSWNASLDNGTVRAIAVAGPGQMYIAGSFTSIHQQPRLGLAGLNPNGGGLLSLNQPVSSGGTVNALEVANGWLYVGGSFSTIGGVPSTRNLARINTTTEVVDGQWTPAPSGSTGQVFALRKDGANKLYVGGVFTAIAGANRSALAAFSLSDGTLDSAWNPNPSGGPTGTRIRALSVAGSTLYMGGEFSSVGSSSRSNLAAVSAAGSGTVLQWNPLAGNAVYAVAQNCATDCGGQTDRIAAGGTFRSVGVQLRQNLLSLNTDTGTPTGWNPRPNGPVNALAMARGGIYVGGSFSQLDGEPSGARDNLALFSADPGELPELNVWSPDQVGVVNVLYTTTDKLYVGTNTAFRVGFRLPSYEAQPVTYVAAWTLDTGHLDDSWNPQPNGPVTAIAENDNVIYLGGSFSQLGSSPIPLPSGHLPVTKHNLAAVNGPYPASCDVTPRPAGCPPWWSAGADTGWSPEPNATVRALSFSGGRLYVGGDFTIISNSSGYPYLASYLPVGQGGTIVGWGPPVPNAAVTSLAGDDTALYVGGRFTTVENQPRSGFAALDQTTGALAPFSPATEVAPGAADASGSARALDLTDGELWAGGDWYAVGSAAQSGIAAFPAYGYLSEPTQATRTRRRLTLGARVGTSIFNRVRLEYKRADESWAPIPAGNMRDASNNSAVATPLSISGGVVPTVVWDMPATKRASPPTEHGINFQNGDVQVRAVFVEPNGAEYTTPPTTVNLDQDAPGTDDATEALGPGTLDLLTGNYKITRDDVSETGFASDLTFSRTYSSRNPATSGPLGPGWVTSLPVDSAASPYTELKVEPFEVDEDLVLESVTITASDSSKFVFVYFDGQYWPEPGSEDLVLTRPDGASYSLKDIDGNETIFRADNGVDYLPKEIRSPGDGNTTTIDRDSQGRPIRIYAPGGNYQLCDVGRNVNCRWLDLGYTQEPQGLRLTSITLDTIDPSSQALQRLELFGYDYDQNGYLQRAWDKRITPSLAESYTYSNGRLATLTPAGQDPWTFTYGSVLLGDPNPGRLTRLERAAMKTTVVYGVEVSGSSCLARDMSASQVASWGQQDVPTDATAIFPPDYVPSSTYACSGLDFHHATTHYMDRYGRETNVVNPSGVDEDSRGFVSTTEWDVHNNVVRELTPSNRLRALDAGAGQSAAQSNLLDTKRTFDPGGTDLREERGPLHAIKLASGEEVDARQHVINEYYNGSPSGTALHLLTKTTEGAEIANRSDQDQRSTTYTYFDDGESLGRKLRKPTSVIVKPGGYSPILTTRIRYTPEGLVSKRSLPGALSGADAHTTETLYYRADNQSADSRCNNKPQWKNLPCIVRPAAQTAGNPDLPTQLFEYNRLYQVTRRTDYVGSKQRASETDYDDAGRITGERIQSDVGDTVREAKVSYNQATGLLERTYLPETDDAPMVEVTRTYDTLGRIREYRDADGGLTTTDYDAVGRVHKVTTPRGDQTYAYDPYAGRLMLVWDSVAPDRPFSASYDADGQLTQQILPNGVKQQFTYDETGSAVDLRYQRAQTTWLHWSIRESIHGQWLSQVGEELGASTDQQYSYDGIGRLTQVKDTTGGACTVRSYEYDEDSNRQTMTTRSPNPTCSGTASTKGYTYDDADRLRSTGLTYDDLGRITTLPASLAGGSAPLITSYYGNDLVHTQEQGNVKNTYALDPLRRQQSRVQRVSLTDTTEKYHYSDDSDSPAWTEEIPANGPQSWTRVIEGIGGDLGGLQKSDGTALLQLTNLHGDVVATCGVSATAPPPSETLGSDEFGVPEGQTQPPKYGWLGAKQRRTELDSGVIQMGVRTYVPTLGRFLQVDPVPGGSANSYDYANGDPVNAYDLTGQTCSVVKKQASKNKKTKRISVVFGLRCSPHTHWHVVGTIRRRECISDVVPYPERKCPSDPLHKAPGSFFDTSSPVTTKPLKGKGSTYIRMSFDGCDDKWTYFGLLYYADERGKRHPVKTNDVTC